MLILIVYTVGTLLIFVYFYCKDTKFTNTEQYLLADHSSTWPVIAAALFSAGTSSEHFVGLASETQVYGLRILIYELQAVVQIMILGYIIGPQLFRMKLVTTSEFFEHRFHPTCRIVYAIWTLLLYVLAKIGVTIYAVATIYDTLFGLSKYTSAVIILIIPVIYAMAAGARAIFISEMWHTVFILLGAGLFTLYISGGNDPTPVEFYRPAAAQPPPPDLPLPALLLGTPVMAAWAWNFDQVSAQCIFSAASVSDIKRGCMVAAVCRLVCAILLMLPGYLVGEIPYAELIQHQPYWIQGAILAAITAAAISSLAGIFNATTTIFIYDIYKKIRPTTPEQQLITTAKLMNLFLGLISIALLPVVTTWGDNLYVFITEILSHITPGFVGCYVFGLYYPTGSTECAKWIMIIFPILGLGRWVWSKFYKDSLNQSLLAQMWWCHDLYFSLGVCLLTLAILSYCHKTPPTASKIIPGPEMKSIRVV